MLVKDLEGNTISYGYCVDTEGKGRNLESCLHVGFRREEGDHQERRITLQDNADNTVS